MARYFMFLSVVLLSSLCLTFLLLPTDSRKCGCRRMCDMRRLLPLFELGVVGVLLIHILIYLCGWQKIQKPEEWTVLQRGCW
jgi:protein-S-isoprenylcysteine O-methyltransferase Ste14